MQAPAIDEMLERVRTAGVVDALSGQPVHALLAKPATTLVVSGVEGEPGFIVNTLLLSRNEKEIAQVLLYFREAGFRRVVVGVNDWTVDEAPGVQELCEESGAELVEVNGELRGGHEAALLDAALHRYLAPGTKAAQSGAAVLGLETLLHIHGALFRGRPMTTKIVQVAGDVEVAQAFDAPIGTPFSILTEWSTKEPADGFDAEPLLAATRLGETEQFAADGGVPGAPLGPGGPQPAVGKSTDIVLIRDRELGAMGSGGLSLALESVAPPEAIVTPTATEVIEAFDGTLGPEPQVRIRDGTRVKPGTVLAEPTRPGPWVPLHASIEGIGSIEPTAIRIRKVA
ncbi:MAG: hypothetical protein ACYDDF_06650 [Thermoplasmatota archaeon]